MSVMFKFSKPGWELLKDKKLYETPIFSLHQLQLNPPEFQSNHPYYILKAPEWINVIPLTAENEIVLVEQYRVGIDETTLELPGGMVDPGEKPLEACKRELHEETGYLSDEWEKLGRTSSNPAILNNFTHLYVARNCSYTGSNNPDGSEDIKVHTMPLNRFLSLVQNGTVHHAIVLAAVAQFLLNERDLE
ncbi:NUDIX hydrolase [Rhodohalobacter halophilus]|uniref:NUDIX hydrolase n=1 Tax=Rhodohalobacter halophilus TaxID=1812810 RepID=UPI0009FF196E|nr:NUDIX hydrolase [Rhodohalobacter halophilus]